MGGFSRRLEGTNVDPEMTEGVGARVADPLWALTRQWQVGEFAGEDAASPVFMTAEVDSIPITGVMLGGGRQPAGPEIPLEPLVEAEAVRTGPGGLRERVESGEALVGQLRASPRASRALAPLRDAYGFSSRDLRPDPLDPVVNPKANKPVT